MPNKPKLLSGVAKAEVLAGTVHLFTSHMPKVWKQVPAWLRAQIKQAMTDCSIEYKDLTRKELKACVDYTAWLNEKYPQPGSTLDVLLRKKRKPRYLHYAIVSNDWKDATTGSGQTGCMEAKNKKQAMSQLTEDSDHVERMPKRKCPVCNE
jgi:hypothetical protein